MELKVQELSLPKALEFNYEELRTELVSRLDQYKTVVYTEDLIKEAKNDRANLNKLKKALNDERIRLEKEYMQPFMDFKGKIAELVKLIDEASGCVDRQVKEFEELKKAEKKKEIENAFRTEFANDMPWLRLDQIWDERWLNASAKMSAIEKALKDHREVITREIEILERLKEYSFEAIESYKRNLNLSTAMQYADDLALMAAEKLRIEQEKEREALATKSAETVEIPMIPSESEEIIIQKEESPLQKKTTEIERIWLNFSVHVSMEEAVKLSEFMKALGIEYKRI